MQNEAADFTSDAANYEPTADIAVWGMDRTSWPVCCEEEGGAEFEYKSPADPSSTEDDEEGGSAINEGAAGMPASCRFYAHIGCVCGHCPNCPLAVLMPDSDEDDDSSQRRRAVIPVRARLATSRPLLSLPATPLTLLRSTQRTVAACQISRLICAVTTDCTVLSRCLGWGRPANTDLQSSRIINCTSSERGGHVGLYLLTAALCQRSPKFQAAA